MQKGDPGSTGEGGQAAAGNSHGLRDTSPLHGPSLAQQAAASITGWGITFSWATFTCAGRLVTRLTAATLS